MRGMFRAFLSSSERSLENIVRWTLDMTRDMLHVTRDMLLKLQMNLCEDFTILLRDCKIYTNLRLKLYTWHPACDTWHVTGTHTATSPWSTSGARSSSAPGETSSRTTGAWWRQFTSDVNDFFSQYSEDRVHLRAGCLSPKLSNHCGVALCYLLCFVTVTNNCDDTTQL